MGNKPNAMEGSGDLSKLKDSLMNMSELNDDDILHFLEINSNFQHRDLWENVISEISNNFIKYRHIYSLLLVWHMMKGYTYLSFGARLGVTDRTCRRWALDFPEFKAAREIGNGFMRYKWENIATTSAEGTNKGNAATIIFALKNYFPEEFKDKRELEMTGHMYIIDTGIDRSVPQHVDVDSEKTSVEKALVTDGDIETVVYQEQNDDLIESAEDEEIFLDKLL